MIPYSRQSIDETDIAAVKAVLRSDFLTQGPANERFERDFARLHQTRHAIAMSNATVALHLGCLALGVGRGDLVWTSPDETWADELNKMFTAPPVEGEPRVVTGRHLLYQTAARLGGTARQSQQSEPKAALV